MFHIDNCSARLSESERPAKIESISLVINDTS